jgi:hypothetical protein
VRRIRPHCGTATRASSGEVRIANRTTSTTLAQQVNAPAAQRRPGAGATEVAVTQPQDNHPDDDGLLRFIADPATRDTVEEEAFGRGGVEDVLPSADGQTVTVLFGDGVAKTYRPIRGADGTPD